MFGMRLWVDLLFESFSHHCSSHLSTWSASTRRCNFLRQLFFTFYRYGCITAPSMVFRFLIFLVRLLSLKLCGRPIPFSTRTLFAPLAAFAEEFYCVIPRCSICVGYATLRCSTSLVPFLRLSVRLFIRLSAWYLSMCPTVVMSQTPGDERSRKWIRLGPFFQHSSPKTIFNISPQMSIA